MATDPRLHPALTPAELTVLFQAAIDQSYNAVVITDAQPSPAGPLIVYANPAFCQMTGYALAELIGKSPRILQGQDTDAGVIDRLRECLREGRFFEGSTINYRKDGTAYVVQWNISPIRDADDNITHFVSVQQNISAMIAAEQARDLLATALNDSPDAILITDHQSKIVFVNQSFLDLTGYTQEETLGKTPALLHSGVHDARFYRDLWETLRKGKSFRYVFTNRRKDGSLFHAEESIAPVRNAKGEITHFVSFSKDSTARVNAERELKEQATKDPLTGLWNRRSGEVMLKSQRASANAMHQPFCVIMADIDHFKRINDGFGHSVGDRIIVNTGKILQAKVRNCDAVIRWGGEEFLLLLPYCELSAALEIAERIRLAVYEYDDAQVGTFSLSMGVAEARPGQDIVDLIDNADKALYQAKAEGRNCVRSSQP